MWAFDPSSATDSDATTTSGLGSGSSSGSKSKSSRSYLQLMLCCFLLNSCPHTKFHQNQTTNIEVSVGFGWLVGPVSQKIWMNELSKKRTMDRYQWSFLPINKGKKSSPVGLKAAITFYINPRSQILENKEDEKKRKRDMNFAEAVMNWQTWEVS